RPTATASVPKTPCLPRCARVWPCWLTTRACRRCRRHLLHSTANSTPLMSTHDHAASGTPETCTGRKTTHSSQGTQHHPDGGRIRRPAADPCPQAGLDSCACTLLGTHPASEGHAAQAEAAHRVRRGGLPEPARVLRRWHRHLHDHG